MTMRSKTTRKAPTKPKRSAWDKAVDASIRENKAALDELARK